MKKFSEFPFLAQLGMMAGLSLVIVLGGEFLFLNGMRTANDELRNKVKAQEDENDKVRPLETQRNKLKVDNEQLEQRLATLRLIVPQDKEADAFIRMVQEAGVQSGVNIRRFTAKPTQAREFYVEMPFELNLDGNYYTVLQFFDRLSKLTRIINVGNLAIGPTTGSAKGVKGRYLYTPNETIVSACTLTTFFSREPQPAKK